MKKTGFTFFLLLIVSFAFAQYDLVTPRNLLSNYENGFRSHDGAPGVNYWQNHADYTINVELLPEDRMIKGNESILYYNESPDTLKELVIALYQNVLNKESKRVFQIPKSILPDTTVFIEQLEIGGEAVDFDEQTSRTNTNLIVKLKNYIAPGQKVTIEASWHYQMLNGLQLRTSDYGNGVFFVGYFYPKIAVYDDVDGWDKLDHNVLHEFYSDFNRYEVKITAPSDYLVSATGRLQNSEAILLPKYEERYQAALQAEKVIKIVDSLDVEAGNITKKAAKHTWYYKADLAQILPSVPVKMPCGMVLRLN